MKERSDRNRAWTSNQRDEFDRCLEALLDQTQLKSRKEWAEFLDVTESAISQWIKGDTLPRPSVLRQIWQYVVDAKIESAVVDDFIAMAEKPSHTVSRHSGRIGPSVKAYIMRPIFDQFWRRFQELPLLEQERVLEEAKDLITPVKKPVITDVTRSFSSALPARQPWPPARSRAERIPFCGNDRLVLEKAMVVAKEFVRTRNQTRLTSIVSEVVARLRRDDESIVSSLPVLPQEILAGFLTDSNYTVLAQVEGHDVPVTVEGDNVASVLEVAVEEDVFIRPANSFDRRPSRPKRSRDLIAK